MNAGTAKGYPVALSPDQLMAKAREITGIDIVDHDVVEPLNILHRSFCEESRLSEEGAAAKQKMLLRLLSNRLRMQRDFARHPEILDEKLKGVVFVYGLARSGTTKTQKVLAASGDFNWLPYWQTYNPSLLTGSRDESPESRIREAEEHCRWFETRSPESMITHHFQTHEPEEETMLAKHCFRSMTPMGFAEVPSFMQWLSTQDSAQMFTFLRDALKYLQWQRLADASKPWVLKAPIYFGMELELLKVFPEARLVMTHRSPLQVVPSMCKLLQSFHAPYTDLYPEPEILCRGFAAQMSHHLAIREAHPELPLLDLGFDEVCNHMNAALEKIYAHAGMILTSTACENLSQWEVENPMHKKGVNRYSIDEYSLSEDHIKRLFVDYQALLNTKFNH